jgi:hypothetical protein
MDAQAIMPFPMSDEPPQIKVFRTFKGELTIFAEPAPAAAWEKVAHVEVAGSHAFVSSVLAMAADAFKEDQER